MRDSGQILRQIGAQSADPAIGRLIDALALQLETEIDRHTSQLQVLFGTIELNADETRRHVAALQASVETLQAQFLKVLELSENLQNALLELIAQGQARARGAGS